MCALDAFRWRRLNQTVSSPALRFFGKYSYGLYVCHQPIIVLFSQTGWDAERLTRIFGNRLAALVALNAGAFAVCIGVALVSWNVLEKHFLKLKDASTTRRTAA